MAAYDLAGPDSLTEGIGTNREMSDVLLRQIFVDTNTGEIVAEPNHHNGSAHNAFLANIDSGRYVVVADEYFDMEEGVVIPFPNTAEKVRKLFAEVRAGKVIGRQVTVVRERFGGLWD